MIDDWTRSGIVLASVFDHVILIFYFSIYRGRGTRRTVSFNELNLMEINNNY